MCGLSPKTTVCVCVCVCVCGYVGVWVCGCMCECVHVCVGTYVHMYMYNEDLKLQHQTYIVIPSYRQDIISLCSPTHLDDLCVFLVPRGVLCVLLPVLHINLW